MLTISKLKKSYQHLSIFNNVNLELTDTKYCLVGPNGSGKTTLLMLLAAIEHAEQGTISYNQQPISDCKLAKCIGISSDKIIIPPFLTARQVIQFHCGQYCCEFPETYVNALNFDAHIGKSVDSLSLGNQKKLSLILAMSHAPALLLLDEPTIGLDSPSKHWLLNTLEQRQQLLIVTSHETDFTNNDSYTKLDVTLL